MQAPSKAIPKNRDRFQSQALVWAVGGLLVLFLLYTLHFAGRWPNALRPVFFETGVISLTFAAIVWVLRAATPMAAVMGGVVCFLLTSWTSDARHGVLHTSLTPLTLLFVLTFLATRIGKARRPQFTPAAEKRRGRAASQVIANLGFAPLPLLASLTSLYDRIPSHVSGILGPSFYLAPPLVLAALAEATADTVSSELGQAFGGAPWLVTTFRRAPAGTDGAVSLLGTAAGVVAAALVTAAGAEALYLNSRQAGSALAGGIAGLVFDSLLGATIERRGWINNDLVNFSSTAFAALVTLLLLAA